MTTTPAAVDLEQHLDRARPRLLGLPLLQMRNAFRIPWRPRASARSSTTSPAADLASGGDRSKPVPPDLVAAGLDSIASLATVHAVQLRTQAALR